MDLVWAALAGGALALPASIVSLACAGAALIGAASVLPLGRFGIVLFPIGVAGLGVAFAAGGVGIPALVAWTVWSGAAPATAAAASAAVVLVGLVWWRGVFWFT